MKEADVIVIGAGIIGAACAWQLAKRGQKVTLIDNRRPGATAAGMGHLVCMDDDPAELTLSAWSLDLWRSLTPLLPASCAWRGCGTLWLAETADEMDLARQKQRRMAERNVQSVIQSADEVAGREPMLRRSLAGGLWVPGDGIIYAPAVARWFIQDAGSNLTHLTGQARALEEPYVLLDDGTRLKARSILVACGLEANTLLESDYLRAKKGLMAITDRYGALLQHQLVELGYGASAHAQSGTSVAFNIQPRPTGQLLIGSSRQYDNRDPELDHALLARMLSRARQFLPALDKLTIIRCWSGFRAASIDGFPLLGPHPERSGVWLALGHEGLGVTTAPGSARLIADLLLGEPCAIDPAPWQPSRLRLQEATA